MSRALCLVVLVWVIGPPASAHAQTTAFFIDSQSGDYVGQGQQTTLTPLDGTFEVFRNARQGVDLFLTPPDTQAFAWRLAFAAKGNQPLVPGVYEIARGYSTPMNAIDVGAAGRGCGSTTGRFIVLEAVYGSDGSVQRFAADFEQHCGDAVPALFGALRYNSTISSLTPFAGHYPRYSLQLLIPQPHGSVTGPDVGCGGGNQLCFISTAPGAVVSLTAVPDAGYVFTGWSGDCRGDSATSVRVIGPRTCRAHFEPEISPVPRSVAYFDSRVPGGTKMFYSPPNSVWTISSSGSRNDVSVFIEDEQGYRSVVFSAPEGQPLVPGYYSAARRHPFTPFNGLDVSSTGAGCNEVTGRFVVHEVSIASDGTVNRFAADFEHHCSDAVEATFGSIRYNSLAAVVLAPFGGTYPSFQVSLTRPTHGRITGTSLDCSADVVTQCQRTLPGASQVTLTATPDVGYTFMGWTEDCSGGPTTTLHVNGPKRCAALFEHTATLQWRPLLRWESQAGHAIGHGQAAAFSRGNSRWTATSALNGRRIEMRVESVGPTADSYWTLRFEAPSGESLQVDRKYTASGDFAGDGARLDVLGNGIGCQGGEFTVRHLAVDAQNVVQRFVVDFVLNCGAVAGPLLTGSLQYNAAGDLPPTPTMTLEPSALHFAALHNGVQITTQPTAQVVQLTLSHAVAWSATPNEPWVTVLPRFGIGSQPLSINVGLLGGPPPLAMFPTRVTITLEDGASRTIELSVSVYQSGANAAPFGVVDTPVQGSTGLTGAVPITGWALDDQEVTGVTICRAPVAGEAAARDARCGLVPEVFVGSATFIEGARPDVQASYAAYPRSNLSGWGFMLLSNMLPSQGNGSFLFSVYARDPEDKRVLLGNRTLSFDNAHASAPFGAIDTPRQGETVFGSEYINFGWALTPMPKQIPQNGTTMMVHVDGVPVGTPSYNHFRSDISTLFPGLANSAGAVGFKVLDTTTLTNGLHTIVWTVTDSAGVTSGIGSRYFRVSNVAGPSVSASASSTVPDGNLLELPVDSSAFVARRGWDADAPWRNHLVGDAGRAVLRGEEIDRFEIALGTRRGETYAGYLRVGDGLGALPVGSRLDPASGAFTWSPGVGFVGSYELVFVRSADGKPIARREIRLVLQPKASGHVGTQVVIDTPRWQQDIAQPFALGGWAADLDAAAGTGIDTLHVWAHPLTGGPPVFLGTATYGGARPDVAAIHGDRFRDSGFGLMVQGLTPGHYDLAVFEWSNVSGGFAPAGVVRITAR